MYFLCVVIKNIEYMDVKERKAKEYADSIPYYQDRRIHAAEDFLAGWEAEKCAIHYADALIAELKKGGEK